MSSSSNVCGQIGRSSARRRGHDAKRRNADPELRTLPRVGRGGSSVEHILDRPDSSSAAKAHGPCPRYTARHT